MAQMFQFMDENGQPYYADANGQRVNPQAGDMIGNGEGGFSPFTGGGPDPYAPFGGAMDNGGGGFVSTQNTNIRERPTLRRGDNAFGWRDGQWVTNDPMNMQMPGTLDWLNMIPEAERASTNYFYEPSQYFGAGDPGRNASQVFMSLHKKFGDTQGVSDPFTLARKFYNEKLMKDPALQYTHLNAAGDIFSQISRDYLGQQGFADKGINYDTFAEPLGQIAQQLNAQSVAAAHKRNEAGKKSGFGGMVKGWASSPGGSLILGTALGPVLGHAFNPAVSGPMSGIGQAASNLAGAVSGATSAIPSWMKTPLMSAGKAAITGGNPLTAALTSGLGQFGGFMSNLAGLPPELGNMLAKQGYGMYRQNQAMDRYRNMLSQRRSVFPQRRIG